MLAEWLLRVNPGDNHGFRTLVANARLRAEDDEGVIALAEQYPDDMFPELAFGWVLALSGQPRRRRPGLAVP